jgi:hypothetical protein
MTPIRKFFARYEEGANSFDPALVTSQFADAFMEAGPAGANAMRNDAAFRQAIPQREALFRRIGFRSARVLDVADTALDEHYTMAKVHWHLVFEKDPGVPLDFNFFITYFLFAPGDGYKVVFYISHDDERKLMRDAGLI